MARRFKIFPLFWFLMAMAANLWASSSEQNPEALKQAAARMKSLSNSLSGMPAPPRFNQKINLPVLPQIPPLPKAVPSKEGKETKK